MPEKPYTMPALEQLCGYQKGQGTWKALSMLKLAELGLQVYWIEDFDYEHFIVDPKGYLHAIFDDEAYQWQVEHSVASSYCGQ